MQVTASDLARAYSLKSDEELLSLHRLGTLTDVAYETLESEMKKRGISVPARLPADKALLAADQSSRKTPKDRAEALKEMALLMSWLPVPAVAAPLTNVYFADDRAWILIVIVLGPMLLMARGVRALLYPADSEAKPRAVLYGAASAGLLLALAPASINVAIENITVRPSWFASSLAGTTASVVYLWFAYRRWQNRRPR